MRVPDSRCVTICTDSRRPGWQSPKRRKWPGQAPPKGGRGVELRPSRDRPGALSGRSHSLGSSPAGGCGRGSGFNSSAQRVDPGEGPRVARKTEPRDGDHATAPRARRPHDRRPHTPRRSSTTSASGPIPRPLARLTPASAGKQRLGSKGSLCAQLARSSPPAQARGSAVNGKAAARDGAARGRWANRYARRAA